MEYQLIIKNPNFDNLGYLTAVANLTDKHDRSAPSDYHWKILKCRMIIFSNSSILACPDKHDLRKVHIIFNKTGDDYDKINSLFLKFALLQFAHCNQCSVPLLTDVMLDSVMGHYRKMLQEGPIRLATLELYQMCFQYTMTAKLAPTWNALGGDYLVNNRNFLTVKGPQEGVRYNVLTNNECIKINIKPVKINLIRSENDFLPGEWARVLPSLNKAIIEDCMDIFPKPGLFKSYKDIRRHWKNIHGYRLPEEDNNSYCSVRFWRGEPLTYPKICVTRNFPVITPMPKPEEKAVVMKFLLSFKSKIPHILGVAVQIQHNAISAEQLADEKILNTQVISLCTPTQVTFQ